MSTIVPIDCNDFYQSLDASFRKPYSDPARGQFKIYQENYSNGSIWITRTSGYDKTLIDDVDFIMEPQADKTCKVSGKSRSIAPGGTYLR